MALGSVHAGAVIKNPRVLGSKRLSAGSDESTSPARQERAIEHWASSPHIGGLIVGWAEDLDVSGGLSPFSRPGLGEWLDRRADQFDVLAVMRLDRLSRNVLHFNEVLNWCHENGKGLVCVEEGFDLSTGPGRMLAQITAVFAEAELDAITRRITDAVQTRLENKSWLTGAPPIGHRIRKVPNSNRKVLVRDEGYEKYVLEMIERLGAGHSAHAVAKDFNSRSFPLWTDHLRLLRGEESKGLTWQSTNITKFMRSTWPVGLYTYKGEAVEDENGLPVLIVENPYMTMGAWHALQATIAVKRPRQVQPARTMLAGIAVCGRCGGRTAKATAKGYKGKAGYDYYRCTTAARTGTCAHLVNIPVAELDSIVTEAVGSAIGHWKIYEKRESTAAMSLAEYGRVTTRVDRLEQDYMAGRYDDPAKEESYWRMLGSLTAKKNRLQEILDGDEGRELLDTGKSYNDIWAPADGAAKREIMKRYEMKVRVWRNLVEWSKWSVEIELGDIALLAAEAGAIDPGTPLGKIGYHMPQRAPEAAQG